jgi:hypothetical protein
MTTTFKLEERPGALDSKIWWLNREAELAAAVAALPSINDQKEVEAFLLTTDLYYTEVSNSSTARVWEIALPSSSGRKMKAGFTLQLKVTSPESNPVPMPSTVSLRVKMSRLRRVLNPSYCVCTPFDGLFYTIRNTFWQIFSAQKNVAYSYVSMWDSNSGQLQLAKFTKSCSSGQSAE